MRKRTIRWALGVAFAIGISLSTVLTSSETSLASAKAEAQVEISGADNWTNIPVVSNTIKFPTNLVTAAGLELAAQEKSLRAFIREAKAHAGIQIRANFERNSTWNSPTIDQATLKYGYANRLVEYLALDANGKKVAKSQKYPRVPSVTALMLVHITPDVCRTEPNLSHTCQISKVSTNELLRASLGGAVSQGTDILSLRLSDSVRKLRAVISSGAKYVIRKNVLIPKVDGSPSNISPEGVTLALGWPSYSFRIQLLGAPLKIVVTKLGPDLQTMARRGHWDQDLKAVLFG
jgi:hypothetical protein